MLSTKITSFFNFINTKKYPFYFFIIGICFVVYAIVLNQIKNYAELKENNFNYFLKSKEFNNIKNFFFEK